MTISPKARADRGLFLPRVVSTTQKALGLLDTLDAGIIGGVDCDPYLGDWNPDIARLNGVQFVGIEVDEYFRNPQFQNSWPKAQGVLPRTAYRFLMKDPNWSISAQAKKFADHFPNGYDGELPLTVDLEEDIWYGK